MLPRVDGESPRSAADADETTPDAKALKRVFIVGFPRSGTTYTMWLLAQLPSVVTLQQSGLFHALEDFEHWWNRDHFFSGGPEPPPDLGEPDRELRRKRRRGIKPRFAEDKWKQPSQAGDRPFYGTTTVLAEESYYELLRPALAHVFDRIASATPGARVVVEQTPENMEYERTVRHVFPDAYFLHVVRDPRDALCSMRRAARSTSWDNEFPGRPIHIAKRMLDYRRHADSLAAKAEHYLEVRYEDLLEGGSVELRRVTDWLGLDVDEAMLSAAVEACRMDRMKGKSTLPRVFYGKGGSGGWRNQLRGSDLRVVEYLLADQLERHGYELHFPRSSTPPAALRRHERLAHWFGNARWWWMYLTRKVRKRLELLGKELRYSDVNPTGAVRETREPRES